MWSRGISAVAGEDATPFVAAAIIGESTSLVTNWSSAGVAFINTDLTLTLARMPQTNEMGVEADNHVSANGIAACSAVLYDRDGMLGTCVVSALSNPTRELDIAQLAEHARRGVPRQAESAGRE